MAAHVQPAVSLARVQELKSPQFRGFMERLNAFAAPLGLHQYTNLSKIWEYPWLWYHGLCELDWNHIRLADLGSELSPLPWYLANLGANVTMIEVHGELESHWRWIRDTLNVCVEWCVVPSERLPFADSAFDIVTSLSVIEHQADKAMAIREMSRVLKAGGMAALSFDLCMPDLGMSYPGRNGRALSLSEFEALVWRYPEFVSLGLPLVWNLDDVSGFLTWHRATASHHNYVVGAAILEKFRI